MTIEAFGKFYPDGGQNRITLRKMCNPIKITACFSYYVIDVAVVYMVTVILLKPGEAL